MNVAPAGMMSVTTTFSPELGPALFTTIVYVSGLPVPYGPGAAVLVMERSASAGVIVVVAVELLFADVGSLAVVLTVAVFANAPTGVLTAEATTSVNVAFAPTTMLASVQVTVPAAPIAGDVHENAGPLVCEKEASVVFGGRVSVRETLPALEGPALATVMP